MKSVTILIRCGNREVSLEVPLHCPMAVFQAILSSALQPLPSPHQILALYPTGPQTVLTDADIQQACESHAVFLIETVRPTNLLKVMSYNLRIFVKGEHWKRRCHMLAEIVSVLGR